MSCPHIFFLARKTMMLVGISSFLVLDLLRYIFMFHNIV